NRFACFQYLVVQRVAVGRGRSRLIDGNVGDARNAQHADAAVTRHDGFVDGGHAHSGRTGQPQEADLGGRLEGRTGDAGVYALMHGDVRLACDLPGELPQFRVVSASHIGEARAERVVVRATQRVVARHPHQVDVVGDQHQVTGGVGRFQATCRVRHDQNLDAHELHHAYRQRHLGDRVALVEMRAPAHDHHGLAFKLAYVELPAVPLDRRDGPIRDLL